MDMDALKYRGSGPHPPEGGGKGGEGGKGVLIIR